MTADGRPSRNIEVELRGPDPGWIGTLFYHLRALMVENAFNLAVALPAGFLSMVQAAKIVPKRHLLEAALSLGQSSFRSYRT